MKRTYVPDELYEALCQRFAEIAATVKIGEWNAPDVQIGPLQNRKQYERVAGLVDDAIARVLSHISAATFRKEPASSSQLRYFAIFPRTRASSLRSSSARCSP
jgi:acyl-CoA reductase-like NAD-dependent aldehyde dehydrogenase